MRRKIKYPACSLSATTCSYHQNLNVAQISGRSDFALAISERSIVSEQWQSGARWSPPRVRNVKTLVYTDLYRQ